MGGNGASALIDGGTATLVWLLLAVVLVLLAVASAVRVVDPDQRAVVIRLGQARRVRGPGLVMHVPGLEHVQMVSVVSTSTGGLTLRCRKHEGVRVALGLAVLYQIVDPLVAVATRPYAFTRLIDDLERITHHEVSRTSLPTLLEDRELLAARLKYALSARASTWGVRVLDVEMTTVEAELDREVLRWVR